VKADIHVHTLMQALIQSLTVTVTSHTPYRVIGVGVLEREHMK